MRDGPILRALAAMGIAAGLCVAGAALVGCGERERDTCDHEESGSSAKLEKARTTNEEKSALG